VAERLQAVFGVYPALGRAFPSPGPTKEEKIARLMKISDTTSARWPEHLKGDDLTAFLYDEETGMPA